MSIKDDELTEKVLALWDQGITNGREMARKTKAHPSSIQRRLKALGLHGDGNKAREVEKEPVTFQDFGDDDLPVEEIIEINCKRFEKRKEFRQSKKWYEVTVNMKGPIGVAFMGDPHVDDDGCDWPTLLKHCEILRDTEGMFAVNIGDTVNNWIGRLTRLYANQETSAATGRKLADWVLTKAGIDWLCVLLGNHDLWGDFSHYLKAKNIQKVPMEEWQAQFKLLFPNGRECKIWAAHNFAGNSQWNTLHGPQKAAHGKEEAHIYACGHTHNWAVHQEESGSRDFTYCLIRSRGYKYIDSYSEVLGHFPQEDGASVTCIIDPEAKTESAFVHAFADLEHAADYLGWLRSR